MPFIEYVNAVDAELQRLYFTSLMHDGIDFGHLDRSHAEGKTPEECAHIIGASLGLSKAHRP